MLTEGKCMAQNGEALLCEKVTMTVFYDWAAELGQAVNFRISGVVSFWSL